MKVLKKEWMPAIYIHYEKNIGQINIRIDKRHDFMDIGLEIAEAEVFLKSLSEIIMEAKSAISED